MATWTRPEVEVLARATGWGNASKDVSYVAMAESSGDDKVVNSIGAVGLLQILQPVHVKAHPTWTTAWLQNPQNNMRAGLVLYKAAGNKFDGPWLDSRDKGAGGGWGKDVKGTGTSTDQGGIGDAISGGVDAVTGAVEGTAQIAQLIGAATLWISNPKNWIRIMYAVGGSVLVVAGIGIIGSNTKTGQAIAGTAKTAAKAAAL